MTKIHLLGNLLSRYCLWTLKLRNAAGGIEDNILQKDQSDALEERIISIGISSAIVYIGSAIVGGLFGIATGGIGVIVLFIIGWILSKLINKKVFGVERKIEDISHTEGLILKELQILQNRHEIIRDAINSSEIVVYFKDYPNLKREFDAMLAMLSDFNPKHLALKYRYKYSIVVKKYVIEVQKFDEIYAHNTRRR